jgi:uncharacterized protein
MTEKARVQRIRRPVWRSFQPRFLENAVAHVRRGGFAAVFRPDGEMRLLLPRTPGGSLTEMARWALLAIDIRRFGLARTGPARGLFVVRVKPRDRDVIREWCERDGVCPRSTHPVDLDCSACGACCRDNRVVIEKSDALRWRRAGRADLAGRAYLRSSGGTVLLRLLHDGSCVHLTQPRHRCSIYDVRPDNCRAFPVGSEACLAARLESLGIVDA